MFVLYHEQESCAMQADNASENFSQITWEYLKTTVDTMQAEEPETDKKEHLKRAREMWKTHPARLNKISNMTESARKRARFV